MSDENFDKEYEDLMKDIPSESAKKPRKKMRPLTEAEKEVRRQNLAKAQKARARNAKIRKQESKRVKDEQEDEYLSGEDSDDEAYVIKPAKSTRREKTRSRGGTDKEEMTELRKMMMILMHQNKDQRQRIKKVKKVAEEKIAPPPQPAV